MASFPPGFDTVNHLQKMNSRLSAEIAELRDEILVLKRSHSHHITQLCNQISALKTSNALLESQLLSSQSAYGHDIAKVCEQISSLKVSNLFLLSQLDSLQSAQRKDTAELLHQISAIKTSQAVLESYFVSLYSDHCRLVDQINNVEAENLLLRKNLCVMWREGALLKQEFSKEKGILMAKISELESYKVDEMLEKKGILGTQLVKYGMIQNEESKEVHMQPTTENLSERLEVGKQKESKWFNKITFWAVSSLAAAGIASIACAICRR